MNACTPALRLVALAGAAFLLVPGDTRAQACSNPAARDLLAASYLDTALNPPVGEDLDFLYKDAGFPNIMVLFDSSSSMQLLPPDGPGRIGGSTPTLPPGHLLANPLDDTQQTTALNAARVVGCGLDPISAAEPGFMTSDTFMGVSQRRFYPPCGRATNPGLVAATYQGHSTDYAQAMTVCEYFTSSNNQATGAPGYDPDFYNSAGPTALTANGKPVFFGRDLVFHDSALRGTYAYRSSAEFRHNFGDGWTDNAVYPWKEGSNQVGSIDKFCEQQGTTLQGTQTYREICDSCLRTAGWYYDGILLESGYSAPYRYPSVWYTGNYLNFFPPKFLVARKVVKDIIAVQSRIRMAMMKFDANGAALIQSFNPTCGQPDGSSFDSNRASYISDLNNPAVLDFGGGTPLASALFDIGRYYHSPDIPWFGPTWESSSKESSSTANQYAVCFSCQVSSVIVLTDGVPNANDGDSLPSLGATLTQSNSGLYAGDASTGIRGITAPPTGSCKTCGDFTGSEDYLNNLPRVAWYLANFDLRKNNETTLDCKRMGGKQTIQTYAVGFATGQLPNANRVLRNTATAGAGIFVGAEDPSALKNGLNYILQEISNRSTSFSVATVSTLQTTSGRAVIVPRFDPNKTAHWRGHLFRFDLFSEFVNSCTPNGVGDYDCDGKCVSAFLTDDTGSNDVVRFISEDGNGSFVQNEPGNEPICAQASACASCAVPGNVPARPYWDAGEELARQRWKDRNVWTVVDSNGDGRIDASDSDNNRMIELTTDTNAAADAIIPYLALGTSPTGQSVCGDLAGLLTNAGDFAQAAAVLAPDHRECAKTIIRFLKGADVLNSLGREAPDWPVLDPENLPDREYKLGDIFHSSPVVVDPPLPRDGILCRSGLSNQCISSLWGTPTLDGESGYDAFSKSAVYKDRRKIILVGANDGLLHAFNGGGWKGNPTPGVHNDAADDPFTSAVDESLPPFNGYYERGTEDGAKELWAFLPPDMISKLPLLMAARHHFFVDGTAMVRDVWVDGTTNQVGSGSVNDRKEGGEFHTVAVVGERRGGTRYFALDVTDATEFGTHPSFLWIYPQPNDPRSLHFGATYNDFLPVPPPIGPVRIEAGVGTSAAPTSGVTPEMTVPDVANPVPYRERWVAFLAGGFDPQYLRGRGVYMVDVWTGEEIFEFAYPRDPSAVPSGDPRLQLRFPIAATVGMVPWGQSAKRASDEKNDRFFDTATFGDTGGQLWVIRFNTPGKLDTSGKVENWFGARIFQMGGVGDCTLCGAQPFFYITANMPLPTNLAYRVFAGTGDRYNLLDTNGGICGPDNIRACVLRGCTVTLTAAENFLAATGPGSAASGLSQGACSTGTLSNTEANATFSTCGARGRARIQVSSCPGSLSTTSDFEVSCTELADGYRCAQVQSRAGEKFPIPNTSITLGNWYVSLLVFEESGARAIFTTLDEAKDYDAARLKITQTDATTRSATAGIEMMAASDNSPSPLATADSPGWAIYYDHGPSVTIDNHVFDIAWQDERTSSPSATGEGLITWNATQPSQGEVQAATSSSCRVSKCTAESRRVAYHYGANPETGAPFPGFLDASNNVVRSIAGYLLVPTQADQTTVFVNQKGQVAVGLTAVNPEKGATNVGMGEPVDPTTDMGVLEVSEELHACRHVASNPVCK